MSKPEFVTVVIPRMVFRVPVERVSAEVPGCLTPAELRVFKLLVTGKCNKDIAAAVNLTVRTVVFHASSIYHKLGVQDRLTFLAQFGQAER